MFAERIVTAASAEAAPNTASGASLFPDHDLALRSLITEIIRNCPKSREQIADEMSRLTGRSITLHMLNNFTAEGKAPARFPAAFLPAFSEVTGDDRLQRALLGPALARLVELAEQVIHAERQQRHSTHLVNRIVEASAAGGSQ